MAAAAALAIGTGTAVNIAAERACGPSSGDEATVAFSNTPRTNLTVSVDSQVDGGTASTIDCGAGIVSTGANGDGSTSRLDLPPGTYTCTVVIDPCAPDPPSWPDHSVDPATAR